MAEFLKTFIAFEMFWKMKKRAIYRFSVYSSKYLKNCGHGQKTLWARFFTLYQVLFICKKSGAFSDIYLSWSSSKYWVFKYKTVGFLIIVNISFKKIMTPCYCFSVKLFISTNELKHQPQLFMRRLTERTW